MGGTRFRQIGLILQSNGINGQSTRFVRRATHQQTAIVVERTENVLPFGNRSVERTGSDPLNAPFPHFILSILIRRIIEHGGITADRFLSV
jgi:hypothetical protein